MKALAPSRPNKPGRANGNSSPLAEPGPAVLRNGPIRYIFFGPISNYLTAAGVVPRRGRVAPSP